ncbi:hypothetical protein HPP92_010938 [Vanilla planifolia]|uniref:Sucrose transporter n=1 Tax=Vanilla planifolia TaxID=51239 RepID=A0A835R1W7_VANPL|nr:hypothetical protein HPP92_010938 [Vanilla planifolia]
MADLSGNIIYAFWMAFGNILGYSSGASGSWQKWFPFLLTNSCCESCANLKGAFLIAVVFLAICMTVTLIVAKEVPLSDLDEEISNQGTGLLAIFKAVKTLPKGMPSLLLVTSLTWLAWFPFILYDTDWMGREIYHGEPSGTKEEIDAFNKGVQQGAFGLLLNSPLDFLWLLVSFSESTCSFETAGLCTGVLNISIVVPQVIISLGAGPWDALFGKGNIPAFTLAGVLALIGGFVGLAILPKMSGKTFRRGSFGSMH